MTQQQKHIPKYIINEQGEILKSTHFKQGGASRNYEPVSLDETNDLLHKANTQPDLLEACELMVEYCEEQQIYDKLSKHGDFYYKAKAAIDKVKGGSK